MNHNHTLVSVRGEAHRTVAPDQASIFLSVAASADGKSAAAAEATAGLAWVTSALADLGGEVLTPRTTRAPLTWSAHSMHTYEEQTHDKFSGAPSPTGRHRASIGVVVNVRDFTLLGRLETVLTGHDRVSIDSVTWSVDEENPEWALVRADAIRAALLKGRDYATALGGSVVSVGHVADAGLLGGDAWHRGGRDASAAALAFRGSESTSLDPAPQVLTATIEARLAATVGPPPQ